MPNDNPIARPGKVAYIEIPALDATVSASFYEAVFGFHVRPGTPDRVSFEDGPQQIIGAFTSNLRPSADGVVPWIFVTSVEETMQRVRDHGCEVVSVPMLEGDTLLCRFRDPAGNIIGFWQFA
jgi:predicted enzyme related to lactoylglutathione lyase